MSIGWKNLNKSWIWMKLQWLNMISTWSILPLLMQLCFCTYFLRICIYFMIFYMTLYPTNSRQTNKNSFPIILQSFQLKLNAYFLSLILHRYMYILCDTFKLTVEYEILQNQSVFIIVYASSNICCLHIQLVLFCIL